MSAAATSSSVIPSVAPYTSEDDALVARKFLAAQSQGLVPILCVGETLDERERGQTMQVVSRQLDAVLDLAGVGAMHNAVVAYEPVWAIGTGKNATPQQAQEVHAHHSWRPSRRRDAKIATGLRILYGGSVKAANAPEIFAMPDVDGGLVGGASLKADEFLKICAAAQVHRLEQSGQVGYELAYIPQRWFSTSCSRPRSSAWCCCSAARVRMPVPASAPALRERCSARAVRRRSCRGRPRCWRRSSLRRA